MIKKWHSLDDVFTKRKYSNHFVQNHSEILEPNQAIYVNSDSEDLNNSIEIYNIHSAPSNDSLINDGNSFSLLDDSINSSENTLKGSSEDEYNAVNIMEEKISKMWENFSIENYEKKMNNFHSKGSNKCKSLGRSQSMKYGVNESIKYGKLTVPQPPSMLLRGKRSSKTRAMLEVEANRQQRIRNEELECKKQFKATPLPKYLKNGIILKERNLNSSMSENSFKVERQSRKKNNILDRSRNWMRENIETTKSFQARPFPNHIFKDSKEYELERQTYRDILKKVRSEHTLRSASMPPSMLRRNKLTHDCSNLENMKYHLFHPIIKTKGHSNKKNISKFTNSKINVDFKNKYDDEIKEYILKSPANQRNTSLNEDKMSEIDVHSFNHSRLVSSTPRRKFNPKKIDFLNKNNRSKNQLELDHTYSTPEFNNRKQGKIISKNQVKQNMENASLSIPCKKPVKQNFKNHLQANQAYLVKNQIEVNLKIANEYEKSVEQLREEIKKKSELLKERQRAYEIMRYGRPLNFMPICVDKLNDELDDSKKSFTKLENLNVSNIESNYSKFGDFDFVNQFEKANKMSNVNLNNEKCNKYNKLNNLQIFHKFDDIDNYKKQGSKSSDNLQPLTINPPSSPFFDDLLNQSGHFLTTSQLINASDCDRFNNTFNLDE